MRLIALLAATTLMTACGGAGDTKTANAAAPKGPPVQTGPANTTYKPAFEGQTRAPEVKSDVTLKVEVIADGLTNPWGLAFMPDGRMLVTEKPGRLIIVSRDGRKSAPITGLPPVHAVRQGGLLHVAIDPNFSSNRLIYWTYAEPRDGGNGTAAARGRLSEDGSKVENVQVIFRQTPTVQSDLHFGSRLAFSPDGKLFIALGERSIMEGRMQAQRLDGTLGKVVRINADGSIPADNPFVKTTGAKPEIWAIGLRNIQGAAINPKTGELWTVEHGPRGGDELNIPRKGKDYGWPTITYGIEYGGPAIGKSETQKAGMEQPIYYWDPVIAPGGMTFYTGELFPAWKGNVFIGGLASSALVRLVMDGEKVVGEERLLTDEDSRIRDVVQGPDGALYLLTDDRGQVLRVSPK
ncbi:PQQ-dependent sugar dehydrogenase [Caulobacter segnis]|uniref:PQQ-dependent sugar dehydrogenase n=1 Tax=Caulobacter segnis TaxID=88688 RepID=UPI00240FD11B|nr:PQQ-dependent sugar dehydrogenase [Caulobacter segnis]MDG2523397.1 PQQ-dependent sugar dehydrogenase [Caulobacter segnis]